MKVWQEPVRQSHENPTTHKSDDCGQPWGMSQLFRHLNAWCEQRPEACSNHDSGGKTKH